MKSDTLNYKDLCEFNNHEMILPVNDPLTGLKGFIAIHKVLSPCPSFGATRMVPYKSESDSIKDALRLSRLMSYKSIMAQLPYGGAKASLIEPKGMTPVQKKQMLQSYAKKVNELQGKFVTGADVGISQGDLKVLKKHSAFIVGVKSRPVPFTALGLFYSLEVALKEVFGSKEIRGRSFAIQGVGKIGSNLLKLVYKQAKKIYIADINPVTLKTIKSKYPKVEIVSPAAICCKKIDVFSPCALSGAINKDNVMKLKCGIILGGANNQLDCPQTGVQLFKRDILYSPDYVINAGGLISVSDEYENPIYSEKRLEDKVKKIAGTLKQIFESSRLKHKPTNFVADEMAETILNKKYAEQRAFARV